MPLGLLGRKVGMTQVFLEDGTVVPVTVLEVGPCTVLLNRTAERDGYRAVQLGFADKPRRRATRPERGHVAQLESKRARRRGEAGIAALPKASCEPKRFIREVRLAEGEDYEVGQELTVTLFQEVEAVDVVGVSKGRGFAGPMKRHNFHGLDAAHGVKRKHRSPGSIGSSADPSRTIKGMRMGGHYGHAQRTARNLKVVRIDAERNLLVVRGAVPGPNGGFVMVRPTNKMDR